MFEKKVVQEIDYESMFGTEILRSLGRIEDLNDESRKAEREVELKALKWESDLSSTKRELGFMKAELSIIKTKISDIKTRFSAIVGELRITSTNEDMEKLTKRVDEFDFENFIRREDFKKLILR